MNRTRMVAAAMAVGMLVSSAGVQTVQAQDNAGEIQVGTRGGVWLGDGEPSNDLVNYGVYGRYGLGNGWLLGLSVDLSEWDLEYPYKQLGYSIADEEAVDSKVDGTYVTAWIEREFMHESKAMRPYLLAGLGVGMLDASDITVTLSDGRSATIAADTGTEVIPGIGGGIRFLLGKRWFIEPSLRIDYHITDITVTDRNTGKSSSYDDYFTYGGNVGLGVRF